MCRLIVCVLVFLGLSATVTQAEEISGVITKIDGDEITFKTKAEGKTYDLAKDVKVFRFISKTEKEIAADGLKTEPLPNLPKGGCLAVINVTDGKVTEISIPGKPKKK